MLTGQILLKVKHQKWFRSLMKSARLLLLSVSLDNDSRPLVSDIDERDVSRYSSVAGDK